MAAAARAKAGFFGGFGPGEKEDLLALWLARGTRWIAVYSCGAYGIDEGSIFLSALLASIFLLDAFLLLPFFSRHLCFSNDMIGY